MSAVFDRAHFEHMTGGDRTVQGEVAALFRAQAGALRAACQGEGWRTAVHTLKGSALGIGLLALAQACADAEEGPSQAALTRVGDELTQALVALDDV